MFACRMKRVPYRGRGNHAVQYNRAHAGKGMIFMSAMHRGEERGKHHFVVLAVGLGTSVLLVGAATVAASVIEDGNHGGTTRLMQCHQVSVSSCLRWYAGCLGSVRYNNGMPDAISSLMKKMFKKMFKRQVVVHIRNQYPCLPIPA